MYYIITGETFKQEAIIMSCHARVKNERYFYYIENTVTSLYLPGFSMSPYIYHWSKQTICIIKHIYEYFFYKKHHLGLSLCYIIQTKEVFCNIVGFFCISRDLLQIEVPKMRTGNGRNFDFDLKLLKIQGTRSKTV